jgi:hypothetical protein
MSDVRQDLARAGRAYGRARATAERTRETLGETIRRAVAEGLRPSEIVRLVGPHITERSIFRIIREEQREGRDQIA